jgi:hypothetical protein
MKMQGSSVFFNCPNCQIVLLHDTRYVKLREKYTETGFIGIRTRPTCGEVNLQHKSVLWPRTRTRTQHSNVFIAESIV